MTREEFSSNAYILLSESFIPKAVWDEISKVLWENQYQTPNFCLHLEQFIESSQVRDDD